MSVALHWAREGDIDGAKVLADSSRSEMVLLTGLLYKKHETELGCLLQFIISPTPKDM